MNQDFLIRDSDNVPFIHHSSNDLIQIFDDFRISIFDCPDRPGGPH